MPSWWDFGVGTRSPFDFSLGGIFDAITGTYGGSNPSPTRLPPVVISERPSTVLPGGSATGAVPPPIHIPEGFETVIIGGEERIRSPRPAGARPPVLEAIDPAILGFPTDETVTESQGDEPVPDWGDIFSGVVDVIQGQPVGGGGGTGYVPPGMGFGAQYPVDPGSQLPSTVVVDTRTGQVKGPCRRRRRRRLLTEGDFNDLMRIATLPNNQNVRTALAKGIGRR